MHTTPTSDTGRDLSPRHVLNQLIPAGSIHHRRADYRGESVMVPLDAIGADNVGRARALYDFVLALHELLSGGSVPATASDVLDLCRARDYEGVVTAVTRLGSDLRNDEVSPTLRKVIHDIRGGGLSALMAFLDMLRVGRLEPGDLDRIASLTRDHCKIMRGALIGLDEAGFQRSLEPRDHAVSLIRDKWTGARYRTADADAAVRVDCAFDGVISDCCMEFAALDRVIYNLIANAARHTPDHVVHLDITAVDNRADTHARFAVTNAVTPHHRAALHDRFGADLGAMFDGGFTTGGHGLGMSICADIVTHGYGLDSIATARTGRYVGARLIDDRFVVWFHWPARQAASARAQSAAAPA